MTSIEHYGLASRRSLASGARGRAGGAHLRSVRTRVLGRAGVGSQAARGRMAGARAPAARASGVGGRSRQPLGSSWKHASALCRNFRLPSSLQTSWAPSKQTPFFGQNAPFLGMCHMRLSENGLSRNKLVCVYVCVHVSFFTADVAPLPPIPCFIDEPTNADDDITAADVTADVLHRPLPFTAADVTADIAPLQPSPSPTPAAQRGPTFYTNTDAPAATLQLTTPPYTPAPSHTAQFRCRWCPLVAPTTRAVA